MSNISHLVVGDEAWVVNSEGNRALPVVIADAGTRSIVAHDPKRDRYLVFDRRNGEPYPHRPRDSGRTPTLVPIDEPRALELSRRRVHREFNDQVHEAASAFRHDPTQENLDILDSLIDAWAEHSLGTNMSETVETSLRRAGFRED